jgi:hypothetical protein
MEMKAFVEPTFQQQCLDKDVQFLCPFDWTRMNFVKKIDGFEQHQHIVISKKGADLMPCLKNQCCQYSLGCDAHNQQRIKILL